MIVNTIQNASYNCKERHELEKKYVEARKSWESILDSDIDDDSDFNSSLTEAESKMQNAWLNCFAAQFHRCKNEWFSNVVSRYEPGKWHDISEKQYYCFSSYASDDDSETWKTKTTYCRVGDALVSLIWKNSHRAIKVERLVFA